MHLNLLITGESPRSKNMPFFLPAILAGTSALGGLLGNRPRNVTTRNYSNSQTDTSYDKNVNYFTEAYNNINYDPLLQNYRDTLLNSSLSLLQPGSADEYAKGVVQQNVAGINNRARLANALFTNQMASRGLMNSPQALAAMNRVNEENRISQLIQNSNLYPILQRQANLENLQLGTGIFSAIPKATSTNTWQGGGEWGGSSTKSTSESIGNQTMAGNMLGGLFGSLGSVLSFLAGIGLIGGNSTGTSAPVQGSINPYYSLPNINLYGGPR